MAAIQFPIADPMVERGNPPQNVAPPSTPSEPAKPRWSRKTVALGAVAVALVLASALVAVRVQQATPPTAASAPSQVSDFGAFATSLYLSQGFEGNEASLAPYFQGESDFTGIKRDQWFVKSSGAVETTLSSDGSWIVSVAAELLGAVNGDPASGYVDLGVHHFTIGVVERGGRLVATGLPTPADAPGDAGAGSISLGVPQADSAQVATVATFLTAYLTGIGDVDFATAGGGISPLEPAPYRTVSIRRIGVEHIDGGFVAVVEVLAVDSGDRSIIGAYTLQLDADWKVRGVLPAVPAW